MTPASYATRELAQTSLTIRVGRSDSSILFFRDHKTTLFARRRCLLSLGSKLIFLAAIAVLVTPVIRGIGSSEEALAIPAEFETGKPIVLVYGGDW